MVEISVSQPESGLRWLSLFSPKFESWPHRMSDCLHRSRRQHRLHWRRIRGLRQSGWSNMHERICGEGENENAEFEYLNLSGIWNIRYLCPKNIKFGIIYNYYLCGCDLIYLSENWYLKYCLKKNLSTLLLGRKYVLFKIQIYIFNILNSFFPYGPVLWFENFYTGFKIMGLKIGFKRWNYS